MCLGKKIVYNKNNLILERILTGESLSGYHRYPRIPNIEWGNGRNETCDLSYNLLKFYFLREKGP
jgi:hypothetical protein